MKELSEYRAKLIDKLVVAARGFREVCLAARDPFASVEQGGWSVHQAAAHVRDVDQMAYGLRVRRTAMEDNPEFKSFDGEAHAHQHYSADESLSDMLDEFVQNIEALAELLRNQPPEVWSRVSRHEKLGKNLTLQLWVERGLAHIEEHLESAKKAT